MIEYRDDFTDLLGAYALDAVDPDEAVAIEDHLRSCPWCSSEVAEHREVASFLAHTGTAAPDGVWDRIVSELAPPAPPMRISLLPADAAAVDARGGGVGDGDVAEVVPLASRRARGSIRTRTFVAVVATAACLVAALGFVTVDQNRRIDRMETAMSSMTPGGVPGGSALQVKLTAAGSDRAVEAVVNPDGQGYLFTDELPAPADGEVYQLWGKVDGVVLSLGTFGEAEVVPFQVDPARLDGVELFAVTAERSPGVVASEAQPVVAGTV